MERELEGDVVIEVCMVVASSQIVVRVGAAPGGFKGPLERLMRKKPALLLSMVFCVRSGMLTHGVRASWAASDSVQMLAYEDADSLNW